MANKLFLRPAKEDILRLAELGNYGKVHIHLTLHKTTSQ